MEPDLASPTRRDVVQLCALVSLGLVGAGSLAACGSDSGATTTTTSAAGDAAAGGALAKVADIPVGEAVAATAADGTKIIIARPEDAQVAGFKAACTHQGTPVNPQGATLVCPLHGSTFGVDGSVQKGPATQPLAGFSVKIDGENVVAG